MTTALVVIALFFVIGIGVGEADTRWQSYGRE